MKPYFTLFWKNIKRFWPFLLLVALLPNIFTRAINLLLYRLSLGFLVFFGRTLYSYFALFGFVPALLLWRDVLSQKRCGMLYSMPVTRTGLFLTQYLTGILFSISLIPVLSFLYGWKPTPLWGTYFAIYFLFYSLGTLSVMLSGNTVGAIFSGLSVFFLPFALRWFYETMFMPYLPGIGIDNSIFVKNLTLFENIHNYASSYTACLWVLGGVFSVLAFLLFLPRKAERTGQFAAFGFLQFLFCCAGALICSTLIFLLLKQDVNTHFWFLFLYIPIFYFVFAMLAEKRFFVFTQKHLLTVCLLAALLFNSFWIVRLDAFGVLTYVPDPKDIKYAELYRADYKSGTVNYNPNYFNNMQITVRGEENLTLLAEAHEKMLDNRGFYGTDCYMVYITYTMKSGIKIRRYYPTYDNRKIYQKLQDAASNNLSIFGYEDWETFRDRVFYIEVKRDTHMGRSYYFTDDETLKVPGGDVKILGPRLRNHMLKMLMRDADHGDLLQLDYSQYRVTVKYYDDRGKEQTKKLIIPNTITGSDYFLEVCWDSARGSSDRTITDETPLFRSDPNINHQPYHIYD